MRIIVITILISSFTLAKCEQEICLKYLSSNLSSQQNSSLCLVKASILSDSEVISLGETCQSYQNDAINLKWIKFRRAEVVGFESFVALCTNNSLGQLVWIAWDIIKVELQNNAITKNSSLVAKFTESNKDTVCTLSTKTGNCQTLGNVSKIVKNNLYVLAGRDPILYELRNMSYKNRTLIDNNEVAIASSVLENNDKDYKSVKTTISYSLTHLYKLDLTPYSLLNDVPIDFYTEDGLATSGPDGWLTKIIKMPLVTRLMKPKSKINVTIVADRQSSSCDITVNLIQIYDSNTNETKNIALKSAEIVLLNPEEKDIEMEPGEGNDSDWIIVVVPIVFVSLLLLVVIILVIRSENALSWSCLRSCCSNCASGLCCHLFTSRRSYQSVD